MKPVQIFGMVVAVHVVAFLLIFVSPGCRSTSAAATSADTSGNAASPALGSDLNPAATPAAAPAAPDLPMVSFTPSSGVRTSPTRPGTAEAASLAPVSAVDVTPAKTYTVVKGDSLWVVAKKNKTTVSELSKANNLGPNTPLKLGQKLIIPGKAVTASTATAGTPDEAASASADTYTVKNGDTLAGIARRNGTTSAELKKTNNLKGGTVHAGQVLRLPAGARPAAAPVAEAAPAAAPPVAKADGSLTHVVKPGESLGTIARKYKVGVGDLATANNISNPAQIQVGQELVIPGFKAVAAKSPAAAPAAETAPAPAAAAPPPPGQDLDAGLKSQPTDVPTIKIDVPGMNETK